MQLNYTYLILTNISWIQATHATYCHSFAGKTCKSSLTALSAFNCRLQSSHARSCGRLHRSLAIQQRCYRVNISSEGSGNDGCCLSSFAQHQAASCGACSRCSIKFGGHSNMITSGNSLAPPDQFRKIQTRLVHVEGWGKLLHSGLAHPPLHWLSEAHEPKAHDQAMQPLSSAKLCRVGQWCVNMLDISWHYDALWRFI